MKKYWYSDGDGNQSQLGEEIASAGEEWRLEYWRAFYHAITRKLNDWSHEQEYRLILQSSLLDFREPSSRVANYRFSDLDGIIFGINTSIKDKLEICKMIEAKCRNEGREDFNFYQAHYRPTTGTIEHEPMPLIRFSGQIAPTALAVAPRPHAQP